MTGSVSRLSYASLTRFVYLLKREELGGASHELQKATKDPQEGKVAVTSKAWPQPDEEEVPPGDKARKE